jgi:antirestriction protein ArdC
LRPVLILFHISIKSIPVRLTAPRLSGRFYRPPRRSGGCVRVLAVWEADMAFRGSNGKASGKGCRAALRAAREQAPRVSLYEEVTAKIIAQLEAGVFPWVQPWSASAAGIGLPRNAVSGRPYSGINVLILWGAVIEGSYVSQDWLTFRQALAAGGSVRKGERGQTVFYADRFTPKGEHEQGSDGRGSSDADAVRSIPFLKRFTVFNVAQCEGLPERFAAAPAPLPERQPHEDAEALIAATGADFRIGGAEAYYSPTLDYVQVPPQPAFAKQIDYYRTALHELGHWTGHKSRLDRDQRGGFGTPAYAREELCAELASAFLCAALGIVPTVRHADYLANWLTVLRSDSRAIFKAASQASKAADYLLAFTDAVQLEAAA